MTCPECGKKMAIDIPATLMPSGFVDTIWICPECEFVYCETVEPTEKAPVQLGFTNIP